MLIIEEVLNSRDYTVEISGPGGVVKGLVNSPLAVNINSQYDSLFDMTMGQQLSQKYAQAAYWAGGVGSKLHINWMKNLTQKSFIQVFQTVRRWTGTTLSDLSVSLLLVNYKGTNLISRIRSLAAASSPTLEGHRLKSPGGYAPSLENLNTAPGSYALRFSSWFNVRRKCLLLSAMSFTPSKEIDTNGYPLFVDVSLTFEPFRMLTKDMVESWLV